MSQGAQDSQVIAVGPRPDVGEPGQSFGELLSADLGVRLARNADEIDAVQALRYRVFYEEMGARADEQTRARQRDGDTYDDVADHLLVVDHSLGDGAAGVVGTYRLIQREGARKLGHFYSADEYDIARIE